jgi:Na+/proline symporter
LVLLLKDAQSTFSLILQIGAGTGLIYLLRWFWWRINAWCEVVSMVVSFGVSIVIFFLNKQYSTPKGPALSTDHALVITVIITTICWLLTAYLTPQTDRKVLYDFYKKVRPFGPGWERIRKELGISKEDAASKHENIPLGLLGWFTGCTTIWSALFAVGNYLYGRMDYAGILLGIFVVSGIVLIKVINRLWDKDGSQETN